MLAKANLIALIVFALWGYGLALAADPPHPTQQRPDIFPCDVCAQLPDKDGDGDRDMQDLNPTTLEAKRDRSVTYRLVTMPGCTAGSIPTALSLMTTVSVDNVQMLVSRDDANYQFTVFISCGNTHIAKCSSLNIFCLPDGYPYNTNVYISDVLSIWPNITQLSILLHEILGHAVATWNEQYSTCGQSCNFAPTPGQVDFMNTGPDSRVSWTDATLDRWERTMWALFKYCGELPGGQPYYNFCDGDWYFPTLQMRWDPDPAPYGTWKTMSGVTVWDNCDPSWNGRHSPLLDGDGWMHVGDEAYFSRFNLWTTAPSC